jgi:hypothetical protein
MSEPIKREVSLILTPDLQGEIGKCSQLLSYATEAYPTIEDKETAELAARDRISAQNAVKTLKAMQAHYIAPAQSIIDQARNDFDPAIKNAESAVLWYGQKLLEFQRAEEARVAAARARLEAIAREERAKAEREAAAVRARAEQEAAEQRRQAAEAERLRIEAEKKGDAEAAALAAEQKARSEAMALAAQETGEAIAGELILSADSAMAPQPEVANIAGFGSAKNWKAELIGTEKEAILGIVAAIPTHPEFVSYLALDMKALNASAKAHEKEFNVPGLRARNFPIARTARGSK